MSFNAKEIKDKCVEWIREWFKENGNQCKAVIGISGGVDQLHYVWKHQGKKEYTAC